MIVTCMLSWYDEQPETLYRAVRSAACIADRVVALDGRWDLYPGPTVSSPYEQHEAIRQAGRDGGIEAVTFPGQHWTGQVGKRTRLLWLGANGSDWVMPLDADWELTGQRAEIRAELERTKADALEVLFHTPNNPDVLLKHSAATEWHEQQAGRTMRMPLLWRALDRMVVEDFHWNVSGLKDGERVALWGNARNYPTAVTQPLKAEFLVTHWCLHRDERTVLRNRDYCERRDKYVAAHRHEPT